MVPVIKVQFIERHTPMQVSLLFMELMNRIKGERQGLPLSLILNNGQNVTALHDQVFIAINLNFIAGIFTV